MQFVINKKVCQVMKAKVKKQGCEWAHKSQYVFSTNVSNTMKWSQEFKPMWNDSCKMLKCCESSVFWQECFWNVSAIELLKVQ